MTPYYSGETYSQDDQGQYSSAFGGSAFACINGSEFSFQDGNQPPNNFAPSLEYSASFENPGYQQGNPTPVGSPSAGPSENFPASAPGPFPNPQQYGWGSPQNFDGNSFSPQNGQGYSPNGQGYDGWGGDFDSRPRRTG